MKVKKIPPDEILREACYIFVNLGRSLFMNSSMSKINTFFTNEPSTLSSSKFGQSANLQSFTAHIT